MQVIAKTEEGFGIDLINIPKPTPSKNEVLIRVYASAICGGDMKIYRWDPENIKGWGRRKTLVFPRVLGHELAGIVEDVGKDVTSIVPGDHVAIESHYSCGNCYLCKTSRPHLCEFDQLVGIALNGGFAPYACLPESVVIKIPDSITFEQGALLEPLGVSLHAIQVSGLTIGDRVVVIGCGPIGLYTALLAKQSGASQVVMTDIHPFRVKFAKDLGFESILAKEQDTQSANDILKLLDIRGARVVFDAAGTPSTFDLSLKITETSGQVVIIEPYQVVLALEIAVLIGFVVFAVINLVR